jgi:ComF family protein
MNYFRQFLKKTSDVIGTYFFIPQCPICSEMQEDSNVCQKCFSLFSFLGHACKKCQEPFSYCIPGVDVCEVCQEDPKDFFDQMSCALVYDEFVRNIVVRFKNQHDFILGKIFAKFIFNRSQCIFRNDSILVPVPLYKSRLCWRGFNQSTMLANNVLTLLHNAIPNHNYEVMNVLERILDTKTQALKTIQERKDNVRGAFVVKPEYMEIIKGRHLVLVDDVVTTGATAFACAEVLNDAGSNVDIVGVARKLKPMRQLRENRLHA